MSHVTDDLIVKPRTRTPQYYDVVAVDTVRGQVLTEHGQALTITELAAELPTWKPTLMITLGQSAEFAAMLDQHYRPRYPNWRVHWGTDQHERSNGNGRKMVERHSRPVHKLGWVIDREAERHRRDQRTGFMHLAVDTVTFGGEPLWEYVPMREPYVLPLLEFGLQVRDWCDTVGWEVRATKGAIASQAFNDPRFYPHDRRKVPAATNEAVREYMPGNHLRLLVEPDGTEYTAWYLDQQSAHHWHAQNIGLPNANSLWAFGSFHKRNMIYRQDVAPEFYGLCCVDLEHRGRWAPFDWLPKNTTMTHVWTSELEHLRGMGWHVTGVRAAWGSTKRDTGLAKFAQWAEEQRNEHPHYRWLKPLLLAVYGAVASRPRPFERYYNVSKQGDAKDITIGAYTVSVRHIKHKYKLEPKFANVLHRGLIEASMRSETVMMAQELHRQGMNVLHLYADGVIVEDENGSEPPMFPLFAPWRMHKTAPLLTHYKPLNDVVVQSDQLNKVPGQPRRKRKVATC